MNGISRIVSSEGAFCAFLSVRQFLPLQFEFALPARTIQCHPQSPNSQSLVRRLWRAAIVLRRARRLRGLAVMGSPRPSRDNDAAIQEFDPRRRDHDRVTRRPPSRSAHTFDQDEASFVESDKRLSRINDLLEEGIKSATSDERRAAYKAAIPEIANLKTKRSVLGDAIKQMLAGRDLLFTDGDQW
jgi:hypothetical protein